MLSPRVKLPGAERIWVLRFPADLAWAAVATGRQRGERWLIRWERTKPSLLSELKLAILFTYVEYSRVVIHVEMRLRPAEDG